MMMMMMMMKFMIVSIPPVFAREYLARRIAEEFSRLYI